jgi:hypothetical protein
VPWLKVDDRVRTHPKTVKAGPAAAWFWFCGICYCREHLTDGFIGDGMIQSLAPGVTNGRKLAERLVDAGLWHRTEGGFQVHDFLDWNPTRASVLEKRAADRARKDGRKSDGSAEESAEIPAGIQTDSSATRDARAHAPPGLGLGSGSGTSGSQLGRTPELTDWFDTFWDAYPRKVGKDAARKAWSKLKPSNELADRIIFAVDQQKRSPQWLKEGGQYIPHPVTWLNQGRWQDEPMDVPQLSDKTVRTMGAIYGTETGDTH